MGHERYELQEQVQTLQRVQKKAMLSEEHLIVVCLRRDGPGSSGS